MNVENSRLTLLKVVRKMPFIGTIVTIANAYAFEGDSRHSVVFAPAKQWWDRILARLLLILGIAIALELLNYIFNWQSPGHTPGDLIINIFPNLLGFGIGVFALLFVFPEGFMKLFMDRAKYGNRLGLRIFTPDMAYPLIVLATVLVFASIFALFPSTAYTDTVQIFLLLYGMLAVFELIAFIFAAGTRWIHELTEDSNASGKSPPDDSGGSG